MDLNQAHIKWFADRGISEGNLQDIGIYSGQRRSTGEGKFEVVQHPHGNVIVFPYWLGDSIVNEKYRESGKKFYQKVGGLKVFYNLNVIDDPQLTEGRAPLVIVEGEMDCLSVREAGNPFVVSVPDGAPPAFGQPVDIDEFDPDHDTKYGFILRDWEKLKKIKNIVLATDSDAPGKRLAEELVRRLGRNRCSFVTYPQDCKDFNDVLVKHGMATVAEMINRAQPYPVAGVYELEELPREPEFEAVTTGFRLLDKYLKVFYPALMVITGFPGGGKTAFANQLVAQLALFHGWRAAIASFEMRIKPYVTDVLRDTYLIHYGPRGGTAEKAREWMRDNFVFIAPEPSEEDVNFDIEWLIERAVTAAVRYGVRVLLIDPWNEIEHAVKRGESVTDYTGRAIRALKRFGREFDCLVIVVAHPNKAAADKTPEELSLYDIADSSNWMNKVDLGMVIGRADGGSNVSGIFVKKVRYQPTTGRPGSILLTFDPQTRTFGQ